MIASSWWKFGLGMAGAAGIFASSSTGCGSDTGTSSTGDTTSTTSSGGTGGAGTGGAGTSGVTTTTGSATTTSTSGGTTTGSSTTTTTTTTTTGGGSSTSSTGTGMMSKYVDCQACTDDTTGAPANECNTAHDACFGNPNCKQIYNCAYDQAAGCSTDAAGACCTYDCYAALKATLPNDPAGVQKAIDQYHAYDSCLYCTTCKSQCSADAYCKAYDAGAAACP